ncbi:MAG TPA: divergent polysaccharide deacetylase family protein, partial [Skermanella sp.]|nr:divergent polysaccharide deacetylase family protein [Skermanella sp.]
ARRQGYAIAIGHPHDATVNALVEWLPAVAAKGFALVPVSAILKNRQPSG